MRIIRGKFSGKAILSPNSKLTRPTTDKVRQSMFNVLEHNVNMPDINGATVLDAFAGTGALGLEALSRGAKSVTFVETQRQATLNISRLAHEWGVKPQVNILNQDIFSHIQAMQPYTMVFCDPPYGKGLVQGTLNHLTQHKLLAVGSLIVAEMHKCDELTDISAFNIISEKSYGDIKVVYLMLQP